MCRCLSTMCACVCVCDWSQVGVARGCRGLPGSYVERAVDLEDGLDVHLLPEGRGVCSPHEHGVPPHHWTHAAERGTHTALHGPHYPARTPTRPYTRLSFVLL